MRLDRPEVEAVMIRRLSRRALLGVGPTVLASCVRRNPYFGKPTPPPTQTLVYEIGGEPSSLDPATCLGNTEVYVMHALDSLTALDPFTLEPAAALATHYEVDSRGTQYTFFLRGHPRPRGIRLPNSDSLPSEFSRGRKAPPDRTPAFWSDGTPITADDFVYSWRRIVDPATAAPLAYYLTPLGNYDEVVKGLKPSTMLAVHAVDQFTFQFELAAPMPSFPRLLWQPLLAAVPSQSIEAARRRSQESSWTEPAHYVSSGPFLLREWKPFDRVILTKNPRYWEAQSVVMEEIVFLPISNGTTNVNLYKAGAMQSMNPRLIPPLFVPTLRKKKDFGTSRALRTLSYTFNVTQPPLNRLMLRYALNLATDKVAIAAFLGAGQKPAKGMVPPLPGYPPVQTLPVSIGGRELNVLAFDPPVARELLSAEGIADLELSIIVAARPRSKEIAAIVQGQWLEHLGIRLNLNFQEETVWEQSFIQKQYRQVIEDTWTLFFEDPCDFLYQVGPAHMCTWTDPKFDEAFTEANSIVDQTRRMNGLAACEAQLMKAMPSVPIFHDTWAYLEAPYLRGMKPNPFGAPRFKYAWIDTNWRPQ